MNMKPKKLVLKVVAFSITLLLSSASLVGQTVVKQRLIVLTDISYSEPDDAQSLVRLLLYSNQIDILGLVATTNNVRRDVIAPEIIRKTIIEYGKVRQNLLKHESGFPSSAYLLKKIKKGLPLYGMLGVGKGMDSEGSDCILKNLEQDDDRPLWVSVWGGTSVLAQALWKIRETKSDSEANRLVNKLRVYAISDQDDSGFWIRQNFKDLFYIVSPGRYDDATWTAVNKVFKGANNDIVSNFWVAQNIQQGHGPLGAIYPNVVNGLEGDTPSFLYLVNNGLNSPEHPNWGSWGGRYELYIPRYNPTIKANIPTTAEARPIWTDVNDSYNPRIEMKYGRSLKKDTMTFESNFATLLRWREDFQNDFAARMDWCVNDYKYANHPPVVKLKTPEQIFVKSGEFFELDGSTSYDPDNDGLIYYWFNYSEVGTCKQSATPFPENSAKAKVKAPVVESEQTIHFILKVTDRGTPRLTRYKRVIVTIMPNK